MNTNRERARSIGMVRLSAVTLLLVGVLLSANQAEGITSSLEAQVPPAQGHLPAILSDGQFVYGPNLSIFDPAAFLSGQPGMLKQDEYRVVIQDQAIYYSINPKVLLAIIDMQSGLVTDPEPAQDAISDPVGYPDTPGFVPQLQRLGERLSTSFYWYLYDYQRAPGEASPVELTLSDGASVSLPAPSNAGTYAVQAALAEVLDSKVWADAVSLDNPSGFYQTYRRLFSGDDPLDASNTLAPNSTPPSGLLKLPYACNDTWYFYQGPHDWGGCCGSSCPTAPRSSVDFGPGTNCTDAIPTNRWITAAAAGTVASVSCDGCMVVIDHGNGWQTRYYHVANVAVSTGQAVSKDAHIGNPSCRPSYGAACGTCGGYATGKHHVHFAIYNNGYQPMDGTSLEGWIVQETGCYAGYLEKGGTIVYEGGTVRSLECGCCCGSGLSQTLTCPTTGTIAAPEQELLPTFSLTPQPPGAAVAESNSTPIPTSSPVVTTTTFLTLPEAILELTATVPASVPASAPGRTIGGHASELASARFHIVDGAFRRSDDPTTSASFVMDSSRWTVADLHSSQSSSFVLTRGYRVAPVVDYVYVPLMLKH